VHALVVAREPEGPEGATVTQIETFEQFAEAAGLRWDAFATPEERRDKNRSRLHDDYEESRRFVVPVGFLACVDRRPAGTGNALPSDRGVFLVGGSTAAWARGRGIYRALVRARWDDAVARGTRARVTEAVARHVVADPAPPRLRGGRDDPPARGSGRRI
jgi:hypothetical protein